MYRGENEVALNSVILYMRMWIEMSWEGEGNGRAVSSSIWGCELKLLYKNWDEISAKVILYMRMWIEILILFTSTNIISVILYMRMWIEIPQYPPFQWFYCRHPLYEDVNWNMQRRDSVEINNIVILYMRMWIEMKAIDRLDNRMNRHPLYEDVNWNSRVSNSPNHQRRSSSIWGCELK